MASDGTCSDCPYTCGCDGYTLPKYLNSSDFTTYCSTVCGDSLKRNFEECDDGNTIDGDGCSSKCTIEKTWTCSSDPAETCCTLENAELSLSITKITRVPKKNSITLQFHVNPILSVLTKDVLQKYVTLKVTGVPLFNESRIVSDGQIIEATFDYAETIHGMKGHVAFELKFSQPSSPSCIIKAEKNLTIMTQANNNLPFMFYTEEQLEKQEEISQSVQTLEFASFTVFALSLIPAKINGLELMGVLQLAYFSLAQQENVNALLEPFMKMNEVNGFNPRILAQLDEALPDQIAALGLDALFLNNCSVMFFLVVAEVIVAGVLYVLAKLVSSCSTKLASLAKYLIKEVLLTLMMFNAFNIAFGVGLHFNYADKSSEGYLLSSLAAILAAILIFVPIILLVVTEPKQFGEFKDKLKPGLVCQWYFVFALLYRFVLGYYTAVKTQYLLSSLLMVGFSLLWVMYNLVNLPFRKAYQNYRANCCHIAQLVILMVGNYYDSLLSNEPWEKKGYQFKAAEIQIAAIYIALAVSVVCLIYDAYLFIKIIFCEKPKSNKIRQVNKLKPILQNEITLNSADL